MVNTEEISQILILLLQSQNLHKFLVLQLYSSSHGQDQQAVTHDNPIHYFLSNVIIIIVITLLPKNTY